MLISPPFPYHVKNVRVLILRGPPFYSIVAERPEKGMDNRVKFRVPPRFNEFYISFSRFPRRFRVLPESY